MPSMKMNCLSDKLELKHSDMLGRYVVAIQDIKPGELLLCETAAVFGPSWNAELCCVNCYRESMTMCKLCRKAPLCIYCKSHDQYECQSFKESCLPENFLIDYIDTITPLRFLLLKKNAEKQSVFEEFQQMESHCNQRRDTELWNSLQDRVARPLAEAGVLDEFHVDENFIHKICGVLDVNSFEVRTTHFDEVCQIRGLYLKAGLFEHSCAANTFITIDNDKILRIYSAKPISIGENVCTDYTDVLNGTAVRRMHLLEGKYFYCKCNRCCDPTEMGTHMSSLTCTECKSYVLFDDRQKKYICIGCGKWLEIAETILRQANEEFQNSENNIDRLDKAIETYSKILNPNHYLVMKMKQSLAVLLKGVYSESKELVERQLNLCIEILGNLSKILPGISRLRGIALYEHYNQLIRLSSLNFNDNTISAKEHLSNFLKAEQIAKESIDMLIYEPFDMPEGKLAKKAMSDLATMRKKIQILKDDFCE